MFLFSEGLFAEAGEAEDEGADDVEAGVWVAGRGEETALDATLDGGLEDVFGTVGGGHEVIDGFLIGGFRRCFFGVFEASTKRVQSRFAGLDVEAVRARLGEDFDDAPGGVIF